MIVAGVMSGTSADGVDVALVRIQGRPPRMRLELLGHHGVPYPAPVRKAILEAMNAERMSVADLSRLNFLLGEIYAGAVAGALTQSRIGKVDLIGCHGQTLYHQGEPASFLGRKIAATWQTGEAAILAARTGSNVVSDFRPADMAAGGKGAPLVPFLDTLLFRHRSRTRIVQNLGGIGNLTVVSPGTSTENVLAFDTGPGNMLIDQCMEALFQRPFDPEGAVAAGGRVIETTLRECLRNPFFRLPPPKTAGREQFGREFTVRFLRLCRGHAREDVVATATVLTAESIRLAIERWVLPQLPAAPRLDYIASGGGTRNRTLMRAIAGRLYSWNCRIYLTDDFGIPSAAKEAVAFAVLAYQTWHRRPGNVPRATGAGRPAILGKISYV